MSKLGGLSECTLKNEADHANPCHAALGEGSCHTITDCHTRSGERDPERATRAVPIQGGTNNPLMVCLGGLYIKKKAKIRAAMLPQRGAAGAARVPLRQVRARGRCPGPAAAQQRPRAAGSACGCLTDCPPAPCTSVSSLQVLGRFQED